MNKARNILYIAVALLFLLLINGNSAQAARYNVETFIPQVGMSQEFRVDLSVDTEGETVNLMSGEVVFSPELQLESIWEGNSVVDLWVEKPKISPGVNRLRFAGAAVGGFVGDRGTLFSLIFKAKVIGDAEVAVVDGIMYQHSKDGEQISALANTLPILVTREQSPHLAAIALDTSPPQPFSPTVAQGQDFFEGRHFIIFNAVDHESGIDRYEMFESIEPYNRDALLEDRTLSWEGVKNPAPLRDQTKSSYVYVRAIDRVGNVQVAIVPPDGSLSTQLSYTHIALLVILTLIIILFIASKRKQRIAYRGRFHDDSNLSSL